uniref:Uncharacterized protein n=1 Tax=Romanomermis culicivorax TaxID=13658 RepID=A0A915HHH7_ROMCU
MLRYSSWFNKQNITSILFLKTLMQSTKSFSPALHLIIQLMGSSKTWKTVINIKTVFPQFLEQ